MADQQNNLHQPTRWTNGVITVAAFLGLIAISLFFAPLLVLVSLYGLSRVWAEHLWLVSPLERGPWVLSNGDRFPNLSGMQYVMTIVLFVAIFVLFKIYTWMTRHKVPMKKDFSSVWNRKPNNS
jgi:hypothetical protein